jgi:hypothetical protein
MRNDVPTRMKDVLKIGKSMPRRMKGEPKRRTQKGVNRIPADSV